MGKDRVTEYAESVVNGEVVCGHLHYLACQRHLNDLKRQNTEEFPFHWDIKASERRLEYAETLTIAEGDYPRPVRLIGSQIFDIGCRFGWKNKKGFRRFRRSYKSEGRQNGKTFENGIIGTYIGNFCGYNYGKLFTVATKKRQARLTWEDMAAEQKARAVYENLIDLTDDPDVIGPLLWLRQREIVHFDRFKELFEYYQKILKNGNNEIPSIQPRKDTINNYMYLNNNEFL